MNRRGFIKSSVLLSIAGAMKAGSLSKLFGKPPILDPLIEENVRIFKGILKKAKDGGWKELPIGELIGKIGMEFTGTSYESFTLEGDGPEVCRVKLSGLDCVTLFENSLDIARIIKKDKTDYEDFVNEVTYTRYRKGILSDYASRLHYTSDWIYDNERKGVTKDITREIGGIHFPFKVFFMSENPKYYKPLKDNPDLIKTIAKIEQEINSRKYYYIQINKIASTEKYIKTGDIIAFATNKNGLDYTHTGLAYSDDDGKVRLLHASSSKKKVVLDKTVHEYISAVKSDIGITVVRPMEVN